MIKKQIGKLGAFGTAVGLTLGGVLTIVFPPAGSIVLLSVLAGASGGAAVGAAIGGALGETIDQINIAQRERVIQIFGPKQAGKNSVFNALTGQTKEPDPTTKSTENKYYRDENNKIAKKYELEILKTDDRNVITDKFRETIEVSGENLASWEKVILDTNPHGIIYVIDSPSISEKRERTKSLEKEVEGLLVIEEALQKVSQKRIKSFMILLNKIDLVEARGGIDLPKEHLDYRTQLLQYKTSKGTIEDLLRSSLEKNTPIQTHWFCANWEIKTQYAVYNKVAIQAFVEDLHRNETK